MSQAEQRISTELGRAEGSGSPWEKNSRDAAPADEVEYDAVVIGAGLGGLAACIHLRRAGLRVACVEPEPFPHARVGESLDWSSPALLKTLGLQREQLIADKIAVYKRNIKIRPVGKEEWEGYPEDWLSRWPMKFELVTLQVDRVKLDQRLFETAQELGTDFIWDRVSAIESDGERITACRTKGNRHIKAKWFLDNSGQARLFAKHFNVPKDDYGHPKVCLWTYFDTAPDNEGTTFYIDARTDEYLSWIWEIPITPTVTSVGCIMTADKIKAMRESGMQTSEILAGELSKHPRLSELLKGQPEFKISTCSYRSYVNHYSCGPNWFMVGESASLPDPLTASGVTAAFRHAQESVAYISESAGRDTIPWRKRRAYNVIVKRIGQAFNHSIETAIYDCTVRNGVNTLWAQRAYTTFSYPINALYSRTRPHTLLGVSLFTLVLDVVWVWMETWSLAGKVRLKRRQMRERQLLRKQAKAPGEAV